MVKFMCPTMTPHYKCMKCMQCYSLTMTRISQPPRRIDGSSHPSGRVNSEGDTSANNETEEQETESTVMEDEVCSSEVQLGEVEVTMPSSETENEQTAAPQILPESTPVEEGSIEAVDVNVMDDDEVSIVFFQDLLPRRIAVAEESTCCNTRGELENVLKKTNELLQQLGTVLFYAGYAVPYGSQQVSPLFTNTINPLRKYRHSLWNAAQKKAHDHNVSLF